MGLASIRMTHRQQQYSDQPAEVKIPLQVYLLFVAKSVRTSIHLSAAPPGWIPGMPPEPISHPISSDEPLPQTDPIRILGTA